MCACMHVCMYEHMCVCNMLLFIIINLCVKEENEFCEYLLIFARQKYSQVFVNKLTLYVGLCMNDKIV